ncbi:glycosyltransferase family 4 protein [Runella zeae]|uniref:glycosyltransferase family 4 protein n=1 Tax=Runella zeae TaxID=94255 RepID=UPI0023557581|nr:glycosyltransferase family 4 protein [Runella zeae]
MKVVHVSTYHRFGGAAIAALRLHHALRLEGVDSALLVQDSDRPESHVAAVADGFLSKKIAFGRFVAERLYFSLKEKNKSLLFHFSPLWTGTDISTHPLIQAADIIHLHWINFGFLSLRSLEKLFSLGKPVVWTMHDMSTFTGGCHYSRECQHYLTHCGHCPYLKHPSATDLSYRVFEKKSQLFQRANLTLVSPSEWLADLARHAASTRHLPAYAIPNSIDTQTFKPKNTKGELGLAHHKKWILFAGVNTQDPRKGFAYFKAATHLLADRVHEWGVVVFGKTSPEALNDLGLEVKSLGSLPAHEVVKVYQAADVMVVPSLEDNYPNTVIEAMACGTPVVGFDTGGIPEQILHLRTGYVAQLHSAEDLARGIRFVLENNNYASLSEENVKIVTQRNAFEVVARQYQRLYDSCV